MTAETDLLPLPGLPNIGAGGQWSGWSDDDMRAYARANLAELQRELDEQCRLNSIGAERELVLATNVSELQREVATWKGLHASEVQVRQRWQARAEQPAAVDGAKQ